MPKRVLLLINRHARKGREAADLVTAALQSHGFELIEEAPRKNESLSDLVMRRRNDVELIVVGGGDGTLNNAIDGLITANLPVGILPLGTANDFARTIGLPTDPTAACEVIAAGHTRAIDVGQVNGKHFLNVASMGLSVAIARQLTPEVKKAWGVFAYLKTALAVLIRSRPFHAEIRAGDEVHHVRSIQIAVGNGRHYGGGMTVAADARIDDQQLDLYSIELDRWWLVGMLFFRLRRGTLAESRYVRTLRGESFEVFSRHTRLINTDGEITTQTPAKFSILPAALKIFVPETTGPGLDGP